MEPGALRSLQLVDIESAHLPGGTLLGSAVYKTVVTERRDYIGAPGQAVKVVKRPAAARIVPASRRKPVFLPRKPAIGAEEPVFELKSLVFTSVKPVFTP
jgi:hypothetical protein